MRGGVGRCTHHRGSPQCPRVRCRRAAACSPIVYRCTAVRQIGRWSVLHLALARECARLGGRREGKRAVRQQRSGAALAAASHVSTNRLHSDAGRVLSVVRGVEQVHPGAPEAVTPARAARAEGLVQCSGPGGRQRRVSRRSVKGVESNNSCMREVGRGRRVTRGGSEEYPRAAKGFAGRGFPDSQRVAAKSGGHPSARRCRR